MNNNDFDLVGRFTRICGLLHRQHHRNHRMHGPMGDPHRGQGRVLALLRMQPEISQKDLSFLLDIRPQSLGELLAKLERGGYVTRVPSDADHRILNIRLTEEGTKAAERQGDFTGLFDKLNAEEQAALAGYLDRVIAGMEETLGGEAEWGPRCGEGEWAGREDMRMGCDSRMAGRMRRGCGRQHGHGDHERHGGDSETGQGGPHDAEGHGGRPEGKCRRRHDAY